jgi:hypothetical protein
MIKEFTIAGQEESKHRKPHKRAGIGQATSNRSEGSMHRPRSMGLLGVARANTAGYVPKLSYYYYKCMKIADSAAVDAARQQPR